MRDEGWGINDHCQSTIRCRPSSFILLPSSAPNGRFNTNRPGPKNTELCLDRFLRASARRRSKGNSIEKLGRRSQLDYGELDDLIEMYKFIGWRYYAAHNYIDARKMFKKALELRSFSIALDEQVIAVNKKALRWNTKGGEPLTVTQNGNSFTVRNPGVTGKLASLGHRLDTYIRRNGLGHVEAAKMAARAAAAARKGEFAEAIELQLKAINLIRKDTLVRNVSSESNRRKRPPVAAEKPKINQLAR